MSIPRIGLPAGLSGDHSSPDKSDHTDGSHILSLEVANEILRHKRGAPFSEQTLKDIGHSLNVQRNVRLKSRYGKNANVPDGDTSGASYDDRSLDRIIISSINSGTPIDQMDLGRNAQTLKTCALARAQRQFNILERLDTVDGFKSIGLDCLSTAVMGTDPYEMDSTFDRIFMMVAHGGAGGW
jgi:hypothetical protein